MFVAYRYLTGTKLVCSRRKPNLVAEIHSTSTFFSKYSLGQLARDSTIDCSQNLIVILVDSLIT